MKCKSSLNQSCNCINAVARVDREELQCQQATHQRGLWGGERSTRYHSSEFSRLAGYCKCTYTWQPPCARQWNVTRETQVTPGMKIILASLGMAPALQRCTRVTMALVFESYRP